MGSGHHHHHHPLTGGNLTPPLFLLLLLATAQYSAAQSPSSSNGSSNNNNNPYFGSTSFNPSMAIVIVVLISAFFFLGFFSIYIRQCTGERGSVRGVAVAGGGGRSRRQRGLDPEVLDSFPTFVYSEVKERKIGKGSLECAVCLCEFEDDETLRLLPKCSHVFHHDCIDAWLAAHVTCPVCRSNLVPDPNAPVDDHDQLQESPVVSNEVNATDPTDPQSEPTVTQDHVTVEIGGVVDEERKAEIENLERFVNMKRAKSRAVPARFPRSHSTGHSLVQPGQSLDRFTLRLPEDVRKEILESSKLQRTRSLVAFRGEGSSRRGYRGEGSVGRTGPGNRLGRSDRWGSFLMRTLSVKNWGRRGEPGSGSVRGEGSVKGGGFIRLGEPGPGSVKGEGSVKGARFNAVISPFDCYGVGNSGLDGKEDESSTAALKRV